MHPGTGDRGYTATLGIAPPGCCAQVSGNTTRNDAAHPLLRYLLPVEAITEGRLDLVVPVVKCLEDREGLVDITGVDVELDPKPSSLCETGREVGSWVQRLEVHQVLGMWLSRAVPGTRS